MFPVVFPLQFSPGYVKGIVYNMYLIETELSLVCITFVLWKCELNYSCEIYYLCMKVL